MHYRVLEGLLIIFHLIFITHAIGIDGKLDFGGSHSPSSLVSTHRESKNSFTPLKYSSTVKTSSDDFENMGVVCIFGGCNTTQTQTVNNTNIIQTDVLVHVQTKVDFDNNNTEKPVGDTPDIPIVVGYGGAKLDTTVDDDTSRSPGTKSIYVPDGFDVPAYKSSFGSSFNRSFPLSPRVDSLNNPFDNLDPSFQSGSFYGKTPTDGTSLVSRIDTYGNFDHSSKVIPGFYVTKPSLLGSRVDYTSRVFDKIDPEARIGFIPSNEDSGLNINIKPISSISISGSEGKSDNNFKENGIEIKVPYFNPSYPNHYYGENPPPQYIWHSKKISGFNPVEFKTVKSTWTPSLWNRKIAPHVHNSHTGTEGIKCTCKEENSDIGTGLRWYPDADRKVPSINDPGSQINDKLGPLN